MKSSENGVPVTPLISYVAVKYNKSSRLIYCPSFRLIASVKPENSVV